MLTDSGGDSDQEWGVTALTTKGVIRKPRTGMLVE